MQPITTTATNTTTITTTNNNHLLPSLPQDDFLDHMLSSWTSPLDLTNPNKPHWDTDDSLLLHHSISTSKPMVLQLNQTHQQLMVPSIASSGESALAPLPLSLNDALDELQPNTVSGSDAMFTGFGASGNQQQFVHAQGGPGPLQSYAAPAMAPPASNGGVGPPRQRVRARRGQATDPHSIAERLRRERIAERMKALQELVPNANKTDKASMLDEIIDYVKFLQLQVKVLSMSRLGGAAAVAPLVADMSSEQVPSGGPRTTSSINNQPSSAASGSNDSMTATEHQVAKLMEEDMGSAMQYLQGKGLCLMPISLASAISSATGHARVAPPAALPVSIHHHHINAARQQLLHVGNGSNENGSLSPNMSVLTVQSAMAAVNMAAEARDHLASSTNP